MPAPLAFRTVAILALIAFAVGCLAAAAPAQEVATPPTRTVVASGSATARVTPNDRTSNASIVAAVERAEAQALPAAMTEARENATALAGAAGVTLGPLLSVSNSAAPSVFGPIFPSYGTFGPDQYCGNVRVSVFKKGKDGKRHRVGSRTRRTCRVPSLISQSVQLTFAQA